MSPRVRVIAALAAGLCTATPLFAAAPPGWTIAGNAPTDYSFAVDPTTAASGKRSASIAANPNARPNGFGTLMQTIAADDFRGSRVRLSGYLRTQAANRAQMWMRVDGPDGKILDFDNMDSRPVTGTTGWQRYDIVLDVPSDSLDIAFGFLLVSSGKVWADDFKLDRVDSSVPVTSAGPPLARAPVNMDFEAGDSTQTAVWVRRKRFFYSTDPNIRFGGEGPREDMESVLRQLGARASDIDVRDYASQQGMYATFSVLEPTDRVGTTASGKVLTAHWVTVELRLNGVPENLVEKQVLPLFSTRSIQKGPFGAEARYALRLQVLEPEPAAAP